MVPDLIDYLDKNHRIKLTEADFKSYYFERIWAGGPEEALEIFRQYRDQLGVQIAPHKGAKEAIHKLAQKYDIVVITSRDGGLEQKTMEWLDAHFPELFKDVLILGKDIYLHSLEILDKASVCKRIGADYLIDDSYKHALDAHKQKIKALLFGNYAWNQAKELPNGITRVKDWQGVLEYFDAQNR